MPDPPLAICMSSSDASGNPNKSRSATPPHILTLVLLAGSAVTAMNIFLPVLPQIRADMNVSLATAQYVLTLFLAATAFAQLFIGPMADKFGRRPVLLTTLAIFNVATLICVFATSIEMLLFGRVLQATIAASIALSRAIVRDLYDRSKAASMIGYVTMAMSVVPMVTPLVGGFVGEIFNWRATFVVLLVIGLAMLVLVYVDLGETHTPKKGNDGQQFTNYLKLLGQKEIWGYISSATFASGAYFAFLGAAPFIAQEVLGLTPSETGFYFIFLAIGYMFGNFLSGRYSERVGIERMMVLGCLVCTFGAVLTLVMMSNFAPRAEYLFLPMIFVGTGNGMTLPNANAGIVSVNPDLAGSASGLAGFMQIGGGAALAALSGALITTTNEGIPLYYIMFGTSLLGMVSAYIMYRRAQLAA